MNDAPENIGVLFTASGLYKHARVTNEYFGLTNAGVGYTRTDIADARATQAHADGFNEGLKAAADAVRSTILDDGPEWGADRLSVWLAALTACESNVIALQSSDEAPAQVGVRPLVWDNHPDGEEWYAIYAEIDEQQIGYAVSRKAGGFALYHYQFNKRIGPYHPTEASAKTAAQAHLNACIYSCLSPPTATVKGE